jgi:hypothetical protein
VLTALGERDQALDQVGDVAEAARLAAAAVHGDRLVGDRLAQERRHGAAVEGAHARAVRVEDAHDRGVDALLAVVRHRHRLGVALGLVVDAARADRVDVAPVLLGLRVDLRVAVDLARRGEQEPRPLELGQAERVVGAVAADLQRLQRQADVVDRAGGAGQVEDVVDVARDVEVLDHVVVDEVELRHADVLDVEQGAGLEVVHADDTVAAGQQCIAEVGSEEAGSAGDDTGWHVLVLAVVEVRSRAG